MADLIETPVAWVAGIYQLETTDPVMGGPAGIDNLQAQQLAKRTAWLKEQLALTVTATDLLALTAEIALKANLTANTFTGAQTFAKVVQTAQTVIAAANIDISLGNYFTKTITGATIFTVANVPAAGTAVAITLDIINGGAYAITWWAGVKWSGAVAPTLTAAGRDVLGFFTHDGGATWSGFVLAKDLK